MLLSALFTSLPGFSDSVHIAEAVATEFIPVISWQTTTIAEATVTAFIQAPEVTRKAYVEHTPDFQRAESGNLWDEKLIDMLDPVCPEGPINAVVYDTDIRTALATFPRSGSTYTRYRLQIHIFG